MTSFIVHFSAFIVRYRSTRNLSINAAKVTAFVFNDITALDRI